MWELRNPDTNAGFYTAQQDNSKAQVSNFFSVNLNTSSGVVTVPNVNLDGRQSKIFVTDYKFGSNLLLYSTVDVLTYGIFDTDVIVLYLKEGQTGQFALKNLPPGSTFKAFGTSKFTSTASTSDGTTTVVYTQGDGKTVLQANGVLIYLLEQKTAWKFWAPATTVNPEVKPNEQIFVLGPYLVRSAYVSHGVVHVSGDNQAETEIEIYTGNPEIETIDWNGIRIKATK